MQVAQRTGHWSPQAPPALSTLLAIDTTLPRVDIESLRSSDTTCNTCDMA